MGQMMPTRIPLKEFIDCYKDSLGAEGSDKLLQQVLQRAGIRNQTEFTKEEALKICRELKQYSGFIGIMGAILNSRIMIR